MSKFSDRSFQTDTNQTSTSGGGNNVTVDWDAYNKYIADTVQEATGCGEKNPVPISCVVSGIVDLGLREYPEVEEVYQSKNPADKKANEFRKKRVEAGTAELFEDEDGTEMIRYTPTNAREVAYFIDIPSVIVDKGQFFGESNPAPYRIMVGGVFKGAPARPVKVTGYPVNGTWMCGDGSYHVKLAKAAGINVKDGFRQDQILELIGKPMSFNLEVFINDKGFLQEKINTPNRLMAGIPVPEYDEDLLFYVGFHDKENDEQSLRFLNKAVKEYIKGAKNYEGSVIQEQLEALESSSEATESDSKTTSEEKQANTKQEVKKPVKASPKETPEIDFEDDIPFAPIGLQYRNLHTCI